MQTALKCPHCGQLIAVIGLPLAVQPTEALQQAAAGVANALKQGWLQGSELLDSWEFLLQIERELERRGVLRDRLTVLLERCQCQEQAGF
jgi:hypothetical protein